MNRTLCIFAALFLFQPVGVHASCSQMQSMAQQAANDMARRNSMDHSWFYSHRMGRGSGGAENVGVGPKTQSAMMAGWWASPGHAANMRMGFPCQAVASTVSSSGKRYWAMELGPADGQATVSAKRHRRQPGFSWSSGQIGY